VVIGGKALMDLKLGAEKCHKKSGMLEQVRIKDTQHYTYNL